MLSGKSKQNIKETSTLNEYSIMDLSLRSLGTFLAVIKVDNDYTTFQFHVW